MWCRAITMGSFITPFCRPPILRSTTLTVRIRSASQRSAFRKRRHQSLAQAKQITNHLIRSNRTSTSITISGSPGIERSGLNLAAILVFPITIFSCQRIPGRFVNPTASLNERSQQSTYNIWKEYLTYQHTFGGTHCNGPRRS